MQSAFPNIWRLLARTELIGRRDASSRGFCTVRLVTRSESVYLAATLPVSFLAHQGTRATLRPTTGTAPFNFNFLAKSPAFVSGANGLVDYERETRPTRARQGRKDRQRENESDEREKYRGNGGEKAESWEQREQATVFHAHHSFYILISPLLRRLSEASSVSFSPC